MPRSSRHKSHKQSKHSSKDYSDSEEDVKMKEKSSKDENLVKVPRDSASGEKRKISSQLREGKEVKDLSGHGNGEASEDYFSSKRRKEKADAVVGGDRWNGGGEERGNSDRIGEKETIKGESSKIESRSKEVSDKGESLRIESKNRSKKYESVGAGEKEESLASVVVEKEDSKGKGGESKRKSERDYSGRKEGKESKDKDRREKEKESKRGDTEVKLMDTDSGKKQGSQLGDLSEERQFKRGRENSECPVQDELRNPELEKELDKRMRRRKESPSDRGKHHDDFKEGEDKGLSSRSDRAKDVKYRDDKQRDGISADKYNEDGYKDDRKRDDKYHEEISKDNKHRRDNYREDGEKDTRHRDDRHREDGDRDNRTKDEKHREDGERDIKRKDDKYREGTERDGRHRDDRHREDGERDSRRRDERYREDGDKDGRHGDERYYEDGDKDDRRRDSSYREDGNRDNRHKEEKHREDIERESRHKDNKQGDESDREKRLREAKYRDERATRDRSGDKSDPRRSMDDSYAADRHSRKSSAYDDSPTHDDRAARYRDEHSRRRINEKEDYSDIRSRSTKDQRLDAEKKSGSGILPDRGRSTSRNADIELNSSHNRRRSSPNSSSLAPRDHYRLPKQDESKYRDYNYDERLRHGMIPGRDYSGTIGGSEKTSSSRLLEKQGQKEDGHLGDLSAERRLKSDIRSSPLQLLDKSPSSSTDRRQFSRSDIRRSIDVEESSQRSGGSRDVKEYPGKEGRGRRELAMDVLPGDELSQADADTLSVSSPFTRNNHLSSSSKSFPPPPPPFRTGVDSPLIFGSVEDDSRFKSNSRQRRSSDPNVGRMQGNAWRGVPSWPSPVANGFMPFPHAPPPVNFHSVMQPFPAPPMFGIRPSMDLNHPPPYHMPDADRFSGPGRPMGWRNPIDDSCPPLHAWDASNTVFRDESHIYGRPGWDHSRNLPSGRGWDTTGGDLWKGPNKTSSLEMSSSEKENNFVQNADEVSAGQFIQSTQIEQSFPDQLAESTDVNQPTYGSEIIAAEAPHISLVDTSNDAKISKKDNVPLYHVYLSKLDISADLTEPELFNQCTGFSDMDHGIVSDVDDFKILFIEEAAEAKVASHRVLNYSLSTAMDDSIFQKAMALYKRQKDKFSEVVNAEKGSNPSKTIPKSDQEDLNVKDNETKKLSSSGDMQSSEDALLPDTDVEVSPPNSFMKVEGCTKFAHQKPDLISEEPVSTLDHVNMVDLVSDLVPEQDIIKEKPLSVEKAEGSDACPPSKVSTNGNIEELNVADTKCDTLLNSDVCSEACEAMMPESVVSGSVNLSRIHHSPESTH